MKGYFQCVLAFCAFSVCFAGEKDEKRLLLNDPDVINDRLNRMENMLSILNNTVKQQSLTIQLQQSEINQLKSAKGTGSTYVIWGRKQCPNHTDTEQVYSGYAGGGYYSNPGSAAEYVCLPPDPDFEKTSGDDGGRMYGAEYETDFFGKDDEDVPCAVCRKIRSTSILMVPGKNKCYNGWHIEYHGYLGSGDHGNAAASSYVCVDSHTEYLNAGVQDTNGKLLYSVLAKCGALQCPPYIHNYPLTCVVCSK
ncbi:short-chain collagen C4-like [Mytilus trossulus]|uniref:short-chain collagen C4-like n=1 Tax=Mytilus trossulus TaxID=6551 RepID=UPI0030041DED